MSWDHDLEKRTIRGAAVGAGLWIMPVFLWIVLSPLVLLLQMLPLKVVEQGVERPELG